MERRQARPGLPTLQALTGMLARRGPAPALVAFRSDGVDRLGAGDLARAARRLAATLGRHGVGSGDRVVLLAPARAEWIVACLGLLEAGAVPVPLDTQLVTADLERVLEDSKPRLILTTTALSPRLHETEAARGIPRALLEDTVEMDGSGWTGPDDGVSGPAPRPEDVAVLFYTSGTTGEPKGVPLTHRNILANVEALLALELVREDDRVLLPLPLHHVYPFVVGMLTPLAIGVPLVLPAALTGPRLLQALQEGEVSAIVGVPRLYEALWEAIRSRTSARGAVVAAALAGAVAVVVRLDALGLHAGRPLFAPLRRRLAPRLRLLASGGAALDADLHRTLAALGWEVVAGYGLTETSPILTFTPAGRARPGSAGRPLPGVEIRIAAPEGGAERGEVQARGDNVFAGYLHRPDATTQAFTADGWFRTGDLGWIDDGWLFLAGRMSSMIVRPGGENVWPERVERVLEGAEVVEEAAVYQADGELRALVVPARGTEPDRLRPGLEAVARTLPSHQRIGDWAVSPEPIPRTRLGKIRRHQLPRLWERATRPEEGWRPPGPVSIADLPMQDQSLLEDPAARAVWDRLVERYPDVRVTPDASLELDLGIDSMAWIELTLDLRERAGVALDEGVIARVERVRDLLEEASAARTAQAPTGDLRAQLADPDAHLDEGERRWIAEPGLPVRILRTIAFTVGPLVVPMLYRVDVRGREHLAGDGPVVITPNHLSRLDPIVLAFALPRPRLARVWWGGWTGIMFVNPLMRLVSRVTRVLPVDPRRGPLASLALGAAVLRRGDPLVWFPEGEVSKTGDLEDFRPGVGVLLEASGTPAVPVRIEGTREALPPGAWRPRPGSLRVTFGAAATPAVLAAEVEGEGVPERIARALHDRVARLGDGAGAPRSR